MPRSWPCWQLQPSRLPSRGVASLPSRRSTPATSPRRSRSCWSNGCGGLTPAGDSHRPLRQPHTAADPTFGAYLEALYERLLALGPEVVSNALAYYQHGGENLVSADGHAALPVLTLAGDMDDAGERAEHIRAVVRGLDGQQGFRVLHTGQASALRHQRNQRHGPRGGHRLLPLHHLSLSRGAGAGAKPGGGHRRHGRHRQTCRLFSGLTVITAMSALLTVSMPVFRSLALGAVLVVAMAVLASLTLVPALLGLLGDRVNALRMPLLARFAGADFRRGFWDWVARVVMRCPILGLGMAVALLVALAAPYRQLETRFNGASTLPSKQAFSPWPATSLPAWCSRPRWSSTVICLPPRPR